MFQQHHESRYIFFPLFHSFKHVDIRTKKEATGDHFNQPGRTLGDMREIIIEQVTKQRLFIQKRTRVSPYTKTQYILQCYK